MALLPMKLEWHSDPALFSWSKCLHTISPLNCGFMKVQIITIDAYGVLEALDLCFGFGNRGLWTPSTIIALTIQNTQKVHIKHASPKLICFVMYMMQSAQIQITSSCVQGFQCGKALHGKGRKTCRQECIRKCTIVQTCPHR